MGHLIENELTAEGFNDIISYKTKLVRQLLLEIFEYESNAEYVACFEDDIANQRDILNHEIDDYCRDSFLEIFYNFGGMIEFYKFLNNQSALNILEKNSYSLKLLKELLYSLKTLEYSFRRFFNIEDGQSLCDIDIDSEILTEFLPPFLEESIALVELALNTTPRPIKPSIGYLLSGGTSKFDDTLFFCYPPDIVKAVDVFFAPLEFVIFDENSAEIKIVEEESELTFKHCESWYSLIYNYITNESPELPNNKLKIWLEYYKKRYNTNNQFINVFRKLIDFFKQKHRQHERSLIAAYGIEQGEYLANNELKIIDKERINIIDDYLNQVESESPITGANDGENEEVGGIQSKKTKSKEKYEQTNRMKSHLSKEALSEIAEWMIKRKAMPENEKGKFVKLFHGESLNQVTINYHERGIPPIFWEMIICVLDVTDFDILDPDTIRPYFNSTKPITKKGFNPDPKKNRLRRELDIIIQRHSQN